MRRGLFLLFLVWFSILTNRAEPNAPTLDRQTRFASPEAFLAKVKAFAPNRTSNWMAYQFGAVEPGQSELESTGKIILPANVESCVILWSDKETALVFALARPPTESTHSAVGVLFLLDCLEGKTWRIVDSKSFTALGKECGVDCRLTAEEGTNPLTADQVRVTVTENSGGRGGSWHISGSYRIFGGLVPVELR